MVERVTAPLELNNHRSNPSDFAMGSAKSCRRPVPRTISTPAPWARLSASRFSGESSTFEFSRVPSRSMAIRRMGCFTHSFYQRSEVAVELGVVSLYLEVHLNCGVERLTLDMFAPFEPRNLLAQNLYFGRHGGESFGKRIVDLFGVGDDHALAVAEDDVTRDAYDGRVGGNVAQYNRASTDAAVFADGDVA